jgi:hypothetical protein
MKRVVTGEEATPVGRVTSRATCAQNMGLKRLWCDITFFLTTTAAKTTSKTAEQARLSARCL